MIKIKQLDIEPLFNGEGLRINIVIEDSPYCLGQYIIRLSRSFPGFENYETICDDVKGYSFDDIAARPENWSQDIWYRADVVSVATGKIFHSQEYMFSNEHPDRYSKLIAYTYDKYLRTIIDNKPMKLFRKIRSGEYCSCYDPIRMESDPDCIECLGTSYLGGYYSPVDILANYANAPGNQRVFLPQNDSEDEDMLQFWTKAFPSIRNEDFLVDKDNTRYIVTSSNVYHKNGSRIRQMFAVKRVPPSNIIYKAVVK